MYLNKAPMRNHSIDRKFRRRVHMTQHMSKIDRRRQRLSQHESLYGKLHHKTRFKGRYGRYDNEIGTWCLATSIFGGYIPSLIFFAWFVLAIDTGASFVTPLYLTIISAAAATWLLTTKWSYKAYYIVMGKYYDRKIERISVRQAKMLPNTFATALADALDKDEFDAMLLLACYPGRLGELYEAYKDKVSAIDSIKNDDTAYREARSLLIGIFREDLKDILDEERTEKEAERKADKLHAAEERQRRRAEAERNQEVLSDLRSFYDTYKRLGA